jgi:hypothetical protein
VQKKRPRLSGTLRRAQFGSFASQPAYGSHLVLRGETHLGRHHLLSVQTGRLATYRWSFRALDLGWRKCLPGGCIADALLNDDVLRRWKIQTRAGRIAWTDATGGALAIGLSFRGLAQALDALNKEP